MAGSNFNNVSPECNLLFTWGEVKVHTNPHLIIVFSDPIIWEDFT